MSQTGRGTARLTGTIVDEAGGPVQGAEVLLVSTRRRVITHERGGFTFAEVGAGPQRVIARRAGYQVEAIDLELIAGDTVAVWMELKQATVLLDKMEVTEAPVAERLQGFEERRLHNVGGRFIAAAEIKAQAPTETTDLLRRIMGVRIADSSHVLIPISSRGNKMVRMGTALVPVQCTMRIAVNGFMTDPSFSMNLISPMDIHGIEIYTGPASIPPQFNGTAVDLYCGLIVIWTKSG